MPGILLYVHMLVIYARDMLYVHMLVIYARDMLYVHMLVIYARDMLYVHMLVIYARDMLYVHMLVIYARDMRARINGYSQIQLVKKCHLSTNFSRFVDCTLPRLQKCIADPRGGHRGHRTPP